MSRMSKTARKAAKVAQKVAREAAKQAAEDARIASIRAGMPAASARVAAWSDTTPEPSQVASPVFETVGTEAVVGKATPGEEHSLNPFKYRRRG